MDNEERTRTYLNSLYPSLSPILEEIRQEAIATFVPIIRPETVNFLRTMVKMINPKSILEVGTAVGFSAILIAESTSDDCLITTIENYEKRIPIATENIKKAGYEDRINLIFGDAQDVLPTLNEQYDFIFMDAAKGQYITFWPEVDRLLKKGGTCITDNCLQDGEIIQSRYAITRRNRTIHKRMRDYLYEICHNPEFSTSILPLGDGVAITHKNL